MAIKTYIKQLNRQYRRPLVLSLSSIITVIVIFIFWFFIPESRDSILGWGGLICGLMIILTEFFYSYSLGKDEEEILSDFNRIFDRTIEIIKWCAEDPNSELLITSATPIFGLELGPKQRKTLEDLLRSRIVNRYRTKLICLDPRPAIEGEGAPLDQFCEELAKFLDKRELKPLDLQIRALEDLMEFGQLALSQDNTIIKLGPEPPHNVILAINGQGAKKGLLYLASTSTLSKQVEVKGLDIDNSEFGIALQELFEFTWKSPTLVDYEIFDKRNIKQLLRDRELKRIYDDQKEDYRNVNVAGIELKISRDVFPADIGFGVPLLLQSIESVAKAEFAGIPRNNLIGIDIGTGSGILAMKLAEFCSTVYATDILHPAVQNATDNLNTLRSKRSDFKFEVFHGDLLLPILKDNTKVNEAKGLILIFNHPYYPSPRNLFGTLIPEGGETIICRFLEQAQELLKNVKGIILMPYSSIAGEHNPLIIAPKYGIHPSVDKNHISQEDDVCILKLTP